MPSFRGSLPDRAPGAPRLRGAPRARTIDGLRLHPDGPLISPAGDLEAEAPVAEWGDEQPTARVGGFCLGLARRTERHQPIEIEVRAPLGALDDVVDLEGAPAATGLAPPAGASEHHPADRRKALPALSSGPTRCGDHRSERRYRGFCIQDMTRFDSSIALYNRLKKDIYRIYTDCPLLDDKYKKATIKFLDDFYSVLNNPAALQKEFGYPCDKNGTGNVVIKGLREEPEE